jgi:ABC-2 type transport system permease protein
MNGMRTALHLTRFSVKDIRRNPRVLVFTLAFPIILLVLFDSIFAKEGDTATVPGGHDLSLDAYFVAGILAYTITLSCFSTLGISLVAQREAGQLKRLRGTPMPPWAFIAAQIARSIVLVGLMSVILLVLGRVAFGVHFRAEAIPGLVIFIVVGTATMCALGIAVTAFMPNADAAGTIPPFTAVLLSFISGVFIPVDQLPNWLAAIGRVFPLAHLATGLQTALSPDASGIGVAWTSLLVLAIWGVAGSVVALRRFSWSPWEPGHRALRVSGLRDTLVRR